jgi:hypothetical protein
MTITINPYDTYEMLEVLLKTSSPKTFLLDMLVKDENYHNSRNIWLDKIDAKNGIAAYVHPTANPLVIQKTGFDSILHVLPYTKEKIVYTADQLISRMPGQSPFNSNPSDAMDLMVGKDLADLDNRVVRLEEKQLAEGLAEGKCVVSGDGLSYTIDFQRNASNTKTLTSTAMWDDVANRDIPKDMRDSQIQMTKPGVNGGYATVALFGRTAGQRFTSDSDVLARLDNRRVQMGEINPRLYREIGATFIGTYKDIDVDVDCWGYTAQYKNAAGTDTPYIHEHDVIYVNTAIRVEKHYARIYNFLAGDASVARFPMQYISKDGSTMTTQMESGPLVAVHDPNATYRLRTYA